MPTAVCRRHFQSVLLVTDYERKLYSLPTVRSKLEVLGFATGFHFAGQNLSRRVSATN